MNRRKLLTSIGLVGTASLSGCLEGPESTDDPENDDASSNGTTNSTDDNNHSEIATANAHPDYGNRVDHVVFYDAIEPESTDVYLKPSTRDIGIEESIEFTLANMGDETLMINFYAWRLHKHVNGEWFHVAPTFWHDPLMSIVPDESHTWSVTIDNEAVDTWESAPMVSGTETIVVPGIGGGQYAFGATGWFEDESYTEQTAFIATFDIDADALPLTPSGAIKTVEWEGDSLVAMSTRGDSNNGHRLGAYELTRIDEPKEDPTNRITEQIIRNDQLRDTLALSIKHDVDRVELREYNGVTPIFGIQGEPVYEYEDRYYKIQTTVLDS